MRMAFVIATEPARGEVDIQALPLNTRSPKICRMVHAEMSHITIANGLVYKWSSDDTYHCHQLKHHTHTHAHTHTHGLFMHWLPLLADAITTHKVLLLTVSMSCC